MIRRVLAAAFFFVVPALPAVAGEASLAEPLAALRSSADPEVSKLAALLGSADLAYSEVKDYRARFAKQELSKGTLGPRETIFLKFEKPFKIFMRWLDTHKQGLQVLYERGRHSGKLAIHKPGLLLGLAPVVFLDQNSPWVREGSESYDIEDAGIGSFLYDFSRMVLHAAKESKILARVTETAEGSEADVSFPGSSKGKEYFASRVVVFFDKATKLPVRMTLYDWKDAVTGIYSYDDLSLNVGPNDLEFKKLAQKKLYSLFSPPPAPAARKSNFARSG